MKTRIASTSSTTVFATELGWMAAAWSCDQLARLAFGYSSPSDAVERLDCDADPGQPDAFMATVIERLRRFAAGDRSDDFLDIPLDLTDYTEFQRRVIEQCRQIARGERCSYGELAERAGYPRAARAVGSVMRRNRFPLIVPCHRVVAANGALGGFSSPDGLAMKRRLLAPETA